MNSCLAPRAESMHACTHPYMHATERSCPPTSSNQLSRLCRAREAESALLQAPQTLPFLLGWTQTRLCFSASPLLLIIGGPKQKLASCEAAAPLEAVFEGGGLRPCQVRVRVRGPVTHLPGSSLCLWIHLPNEMSPCFFLC